MDNWLALFDGQTRYFLDIFDSSVKPDVLRFYGREALSEPFSWDIEFTTLQANIPPEEVLMKYASFRMRSGKSVHGMVTRLEWLSTSKDQSHYRLTLSSRLALLGYTRQCAVYQNQSVPEVVEQVLRKHGLEGPDFEFRLERTYPPREIITQWRETDLQFIQRILSEVGIYWRTEMDDVRGLDTYILADSQLNYQFDVRLPYSEASACSTVRQNRSGMCGPGTTLPPALSPRVITTTGQPPRRWMLRSACVMMLSPSGGIIVTRHLIVMRVMTPARSRKPNLARSTPDFTTSGSSTGRPVFTCSAMLHASHPGRCWSRRATSLRPCKRV